MIFIAKNEDGIPTWKLIQDGKKTVTRRLKPLLAGKEFAVQPGRGKFAVCRCKVIHCMSHLVWIKLHRDGSASLKEEAQKEGFNNWIELTDWFDKKGINIEDTFRIAFELIN